MCALFLSQALVDLRASKPEHVLITCQADDLRACHGPCLPSSRLFMQQTQRSQTQAAKSFALLFWFSMELTAIMQNSGFHPTKLPFWLLLIYQHVRSNQASIFSQQLAWVGWELPQAESRHALQEAVVTPGSGHPRLPCSLLGLDTGNIWVSSPIVQENCLENFLVLREWVQFLLDLRRSAQVGTTSSSRWDCGIVSNFFPYPLLSWEVSR